MRLIRDTQTFQVANGATVLRVMKRQDRPFHSLTVWVIPESSRGVGDAAGVRAFSTEVFFGPTSQAGAAAKVNDEIYLALDPTTSLKVFPANNLTSNKASTGNAVHGFPITVRVINTDAIPLVLTLEFTAVTVDQG